MTFSVLISIYSKETTIHLTAALNSIINQTLVPDEIVLVKDGPLTTGLDEVIKDFCSKFPNLFKVLSLPFNLGLARALNEGLRVCKYDLIARMDSDDICFPDRFEKQIAYFTTNDVDILGGQLIEFGKDIDDVISHRKVPLHHQDIVRFMKYRSPFSHPSIILKKSVYEALGGYDSEIFPEDYDFFVRAYLKGFKFANLEDTILWFRMGEDQSKAIKRRWGIQYAKNEFKLYKKFYNLGFYNIPMFIKAVMLKIPLRLLSFSIYKFIYFKILR
jgi:glycosyltransferase involved in cell wall biosynthesis